MPRVMLKMQKFLVQVAVNLLQNISMLHCFVDSQNSVIINLQLSSILNELLRKFIFFHCLKIEYAGSINLLKILKWSTTQFHAIPL